MPNQSRLEVRNMGTSALAGGPLFSRASADAFGLSISSPEMDFTVRWRGASKQVSDALEETRLKLFWALLNWWHEATDPLPPNEKTAHLSYRSIIQYGIENREAFLPLILNRLVDEGGEWYEALERIAGESPITWEIEGYRSKMKAAWVAWGRDHGYLD